LPASVIVQVIDGLKLGRQLSSVDRKEVELATKVIEFA
jgi:hypothetical protein